jgi:Zn-dependent protease
MAAVAPLPFSQAHGVVVARKPVPIVITRGAAVPMALLGVVFAAYCSGAAPLLLLGAALLGAVGGAASLIVHELGHMRSARHVAGVKVMGVSLISLGAATHFEGAYRSGRDQARVAVAGPAASFGFGLVLLATALLPMPHPLQLGLFGLALLNAGIGALSLLPIYPLDGHKLLVGLVWRFSGSERRARSIIGRAGKSWLAVEAVGALVLLVEKPALGALVFVAGAAIYLQKRLSGRPRNLPKPVG